MIRAATVSVLVGLVVAGLVLAAGLMIGARRHPGTRRGRSAVGGPVGTLVLGVVGGLCGGLLGYALLAHSLSRGWWQPWAVVGAAVAAFGVLLVRARWTPAADVAAVGRGVDGVVDDLGRRPPRSDEPPGVAMFLVIIALAVRARRGRRVPVSGPGGSGGSGGSDGSGGSGGGRPGADRTGAGVG